MIEVRQIVLARSLQMRKSPTGTVGYLPDLVNQLKTRYGFIKAPKDEELLPSDEPKGAEFRHGKLPDDPNVIIDRFTVFNDGVVADAAESTDNADRFLDDLQDWARTAIPKAIATGPRFYLSQLEIKTDQPLEVYAAKFRPVGDEIAELLNGYGILTPRYEVSSIGLHFDQLARINPQPGVFSIERRQNVPYAEGVWFAQAPLKTADHVGLLKRLLE